MHWVYPQPQQQHHQQRNGGAWNNPSLSIAVSMASNSLDIHHAAHGQGNNTSTSGGTNHSLMGNNNILDPTSSQILGASGGPPPSIKNGAPGSSGISSNESTTVNEDEWKNIHVVRALSKFTSYSMKTSRYYYNYSFYKNRKSKHAFTRIMLNICKNLSLTTF